MTEEKLYDINEIIKDAKIARSTFDKFAESNNLRPMKVEKRGKKLYSLRDKDFVVSHYLNGKGKEEKKKYTNHRNEKHDEIIELLKEEIEQLKRTNNQLIHENDLLNNQLQVKDQQIESAHKLVDQSQQLHLELEQQMKSLTTDQQSSVVNGEITKPSNYSVPNNQTASHQTGDNKKTTKNWWHFWS